MIGISNKVILYGLLILAPSMFFGCANPNEFERDFLKGLGTAMFIFGEDVGTVAGGYLLSEEMVSKRDNKVKKKQNKIPEYDVVPEREKNTESKTYILDKPPLLIFYINDKGTYKTEYYPSGDENGEKFEAKMVDGKSYYRDEYGKWIETPRYLRSKTVETTQSPYI